MPILDGDSASFTNGNITARDNPWNKNPSWNRHTDYFETIKVTPDVFPNDVHMNWTWPLGDIGTIYSYPMLDRPFSSPVSTDSYTSLSTIFDYSVDCNGNTMTVAGPAAMTFNVLHEAWLKDSSNNNVEVMVQLRPRDVLTRSDAHSFINLETQSLPTGQPLVKQSFHVETWNDGWQKVMCYPVTHTLSDDDNQHSNPAFTGAVAGTPGTDPTGFQFSPVPGITKSIIGTGTTTAADGKTVRYTDVQFSGTPTNSSQLRMFLKFYVDGGPYVSTTYGQSWLTSAYLAVLPTGTQKTNIGAIAVSIGYLNNPITEYLGGGSTISLTSVIDGNLRNYAYESIPPAARGAYKDEAQAALATPSVFIDTTLGQPINITLRIASPMAAHDPRRIITQGSFDWKALFTALKTAGILAGSETLQTIQFGPETNGGNGSLHIKSYDVVANGVATPDQTVYFSVDLATLTTFPSYPTITVCPYDTVNYDNTGAFKGAAGSYKFQPSVPGLYQMNFCIYTANTTGWDTSPPGVGNARVLFNGATVSVSGTVDTNVSIGTGSCQLFFNGTTDYAQIGFTAQASNFRVGSTPSSPGLVRWTAARLPS